LTRRAIPFVKYGGLKFLEASHIKDVLSVLRWAQNPRSRLSGFRAVGLLPGIGPATAVRLLDAMEGAAKPALAMQKFKSPATSTADWNAFVALFGVLQEAKSSWPVEMECVSRWYEPHLERIYEDAFVRQADILQLQQIAATYASRERFLTEVTLDPPSATSDEAGVSIRDDDYLILSTIHSAKGQEWKVVQILNVVDGCIPSDMGTSSTAEIEEERRLLYVAMTRAKHHLHLLVPQRFYVHQQPRCGDRHVYASLSRFIPNSILKFFEASAWPEMTSEVGDAARSDSDAIVRIDVAARARAQWT
jgi:DNA helicase-2/ATP-dependent DNA helicase PcrA